MADVTTDVKQAATDVKASVTTAVASTVTEATGFWAKASALGQKYWYVLAIVALAAVLAPVFL